MTRHVATVVLAALCTVNAGAEPRTVQEFSGRGSGSNRVMSPAVVASWTASGPLNGPVQLDVLVLWRGAPGWFSKQSTGGSGGSGSRTSGMGRVTTQSIRYGDVSLSMTFDASSRIAQIEGREVRLGEDNVILVDNVDEPGALKIVGTKKVDRELPDSKRIDLVIRRSPELHPFMRCDVQLPNPGLQATMDLLCSQIIPK